MYRSFRITCLPEYGDAVEALLHDQGFFFEPEPFSALARRLTSEPFPLGASLAARFGLIYIQDRSSMLPPLALAPSPGMAVLDMCASPGSKTGMVGQMVGKGGFVLGNEPSKNRWATLRRNMQLLNFVQCATCSHPGERLPLPDIGEQGSESGQPWPGWDAVLLDPPCSGWGTVDKNPQVMRLWQGDKVKPLITLQRRLLAEAARLLKPGGFLSYSTCTTNVRENEEQLAFACDELGLEFVPMTAPAGFTLAEPATPRFAGVWSVVPGSDGQGFFVGRLRKPDDWSPPLTGREARNEPDRGKKTHSIDPPALLATAAFEASGVDMGLLAEGVIADYNGVAHFLPGAGDRLVGHKSVPRFAWKGFVLGRIGRGGDGHVSPALRTLMPGRDQAESRGFACLDVESGEPVMRLLSGQSMDIAPGIRAMGLYFRGLPLARLTVKGRRAMLPELGA